jgi:hypothetical protein
MWVIFVKQVGPLSLEVTKKRPVGLLVSRQSDLFFTRRSQSSPRKEEKREFFAAFAIFLFKKEAFLKVFFLDSWFLKKEFLIT